MQIPTSLAEDGKLHISPGLKAAYLSSLETAGLMAAAMGPRPDPAPVGGFSKEATDAHYAHAFDGSAARAQLALLDPLAEVPTTAAALRKIFAGGSVSFTDVPCGAGAAALAILCSIAELRSLQIMPRIPLHVHLLLGEISAPARSYAEELTKAVTTYLSEQAVFLTYECFSWDVLSESSNANLVEKIVLSKHKHLQTLLLISNFNGFLEKESKKKEAYPQIAELFKYASGKLNSAIWIEPNMKSAKFKLFPFILAKLAKLTSFAKPAVSGAGNETSNFKFFIPAKPSETANVRLCVMPIDLLKEGT